MDQSYWLKNSLLGLASIIFVIVEPEQRVTYQVEIKLAYLTHTYMSIVDGEERPMLWMLCRM